MNKQELYRLIKEIVAKELEEANGIAAGGVVGTTGSALGVDTEPAKKLMWSGNEPLKESTHSTLFHATPWNNWRRIKVQGLVPQKGVRGIYADNPGSARIYLFESLDTLDDAMSAWFLDKFEGVRYFAILEVNVPTSIEVFDDPEIAGSFFVETAIPPSNIVLLKKEDVGEDD